MLGQTESIFIEYYKKLGLAGGRNLAAWTRTNRSSRTRRTTMIGGPLWCDVVARVAADAVNGEILDSELARDTTRSLEHTPGLWSVEGGIAVTDSPRLCSARESAWIRRVQQLELT